MTDYKQWYPQDWDDKDIASWKRDMGIRLCTAIEATRGYRKEYLFAKEIGISQGSLSDIINGRSTPSALTLLKIMENTDFNIEYILKG